MANTSTSASSAPSSHRALALWMSAGALVLGASVWAYTVLSAPARPERPQPAWLSMAKVMAQTADGRRVAVKVNLALQQRDDESVLVPHLPAFEALIGTTSADMNREEISGPEGMRHLGEAIQTSINDYLEDRGMPERIRDVAFDQMTLLP